MRQSSGIFWSHCLQLYLIETETPKRAQESYHEIHSKQKEPFKSVYTARENTVSSNIAAHI